MKLSFCVVNLLSPTGRITLLLSTYFSIMKTYKHIFFDLDHTLYDFDQSTHDTFLDLHKKHKLEDRGVVPFEDFFDDYKRINAEFWDRYRKNEIKKEFLNVERFHVAFKKYGINDRAFAERFANEYLAGAPLKRTLFPGAIEVLEYLKDKYKMHIITNGFKEVQATKIKANDLGKYFKTITVSEEVGVRKPFPEVFYYAMQKAGAVAKESIMIGDGLDVDIEGAKNVGMDQIYFNYKNEPHNGVATFTVSELKEILNIL